MEKELLNAVLNSTSEGIIITDDKLKIKEVNKIALKILGLKLKEIIDKNIKDIFNNIRLLNDCLKNGERYKNEDCTFVINDNRVRCVTNIEPITYVENIGGIVVAFRYTKHIHKVVNNVIGYSASYTFKDIATKNQKMKKIIEYAKKAANADCNILLEGSSGTGKEVFAQAIHNYSKRFKGPFVAVNCAAIPRELVESELFGYEKGAFTGANKGGYPGKFELADGGTIFLDEIGELPLDIQSKLLRVLDNHKIVRVGSTYEKGINVRVISATNKNLIDEVENKNFRYDLYYRLNVIGIRLIDLNEREEDIEELTKHFLKKLNNKNIENVKTIDKEAMKKLTEYKWLGNVRELRNVVEKSYYLCDCNRITERYLLNLLRDKPKNNANVVEEEISNLDVKKEDILPLKILEEQNMKKTLIFCKGNAEEAAKLLGISRATIYRKISKYGIKVSEYQNEKK
ncbi:sigma 54-interacting transcriptional regulator [Clostridium aestuarii]|uniref:Sigma 54-interacting transcriptional regulator n=1 Tax=Clostridium aestuarii TaxID=338193 RepID=A0ABT4CWG8_9CLOT|nr:sigma 54-interacting transcriptional regulator [Clostridium aestuarii]MCY6483334.1 sigma 54-interacting transcriptional regulator [Clostridium aestuarii]